MTSQVTKVPVGNARVVLAISLTIASVLFGWALIDPEQMTQVIQGFTSGTVKTLDWFFLGFATTLMLISFFLAFSRYGKLRLGKDHERPEFSNLSWISMLFAGGMGAGLLFWGAAEPLSHYVNPPGMQGSTPAAAREAMVITNLHWGFHAWAIYGMCALIIGYFTFRRGMPPLTSSPIRAMLPGTPRWLLTSADVLAVLAVLFGIVGSLVQGVLQLRSGFSAVFRTDPESVAVAAGLVVVLTIAYLLSATTGVEKGIRILSNINVGLTVALVAFVLIFGPTRYILGTTLTSLGDYLQRLIEMSFRLFPFEGLSDWSTAWTLTYFLWWLAWGPFVGIFIARISRGRTIREFVLGVVLVPSLFSVFWFAALGGAGLFIETDGQGGLAALVAEDVSAALFAFLDNFPLSSVVSVLAIFILFLFLVTSADSGTYVLGMMTQNGTENPAVSLKIMWGLILSGMTLVIAMVGSVPVARAMAILGAVPFTAVLVVQLGAFLKAIRTERPTLSRAGPGLPADRPGPQTALDADLEADPDAEQPDLAEPEFEREPTAASSQVRP